ncbi:MAG: beta-galactosidase [Kosmotoga sp.]|nr:MAG: beta-galactosidase [Kosmotoga sp.]
MNEHVQISNGNFVVDGEVKSMYSGSVHYWRIKQEKWNEVLDKVKELGFNGITTYIPWEIHEIEKGVFDFGEIEPSKDIDKFLSLCDEKGITVSVRPGPQINSELTWFGFPERILKNTNYQARNPKGGKVVLNQVPKPIPALSYTNEDFLAEVDVWYDAICKILEKHQPPKGNLVAVQIDNEMGYFFNINPYATDYSESSKDLYRNFLKEKYNNINELNSRYHTNYCCFEEIDPPTRFEGSSKEELPFYLDWIEYREYYLINSMEDLGTRMRKRGINVPLFHNYPHPLGPGGAAGAPSTPFNLPKLEEKIGFVGFDIYSKKELYDHVKTITSYVSGCSRFPYIPEFRTGVWPWYIKPGDFENEVFTTKAVLMHGIKEFNRYMLVDRNKWLDSPISHKGEINKKAYSAHEKITKNLMKFRWNDFDKQAEVLLLVNRDYDRLEAATTLLPVVGDFLESVFGFSEYSNSKIVSNNSLGFSKPIQMEKSSWFDTFYKALSSNGFTFNLGDTAQFPETWNKYKAIIVTSFEYMTEETAKKLIKYIENGGTLIIGPCIPELNDSFKDTSSLKTFAEKASKEIIKLSGGKVIEKYSIRKGDLFVISEKEKAESSINNTLTKLKASKIKMNNEKLDAVLHKNKTKDEYILFVANPTSKEINAEIELPLKADKLVDVWSEREISVEHGLLKEKLSPYDIRIFKF